ncbi:MAG: DUF5683 domain-containing protein [Nitrospirota bacterium]|nr:DUF5683 domain-containing protein [Nitrospirota bacterium]
MSSAHSPKVAALLSAVLPGLGQFYNRQWAKGASFLVAMLVVDAALGVTSETITVLQSAFLGMPGANVNIGGFVLRMLPLAAIAMWSITDAARTAKRQPTKRIEQSL